MVVVFSVQGTFFLFCTLKFFANVIHSSPLHRRVKEPNPLKQWKVSVPWQNLQENSVKHQDLLGDRVNWNWRYPKDVYGRIMYLYFYRFEFCENRKNNSELKVHFQWIFIFIKYIQSSPLRLAIFVMFWNAKGNLYCFVLVLTTTPFMIPFSSDLRLSHFIYPPSFSFISENKSRLHSINVVFLDPHFINLQ